MTERASDLLLEVARTDLLRAERAQALVDYMRRAAVDAGIASIGGHTTVGHEYRIGCSVVGLLDGPPRTLNSARPGDVVVLSKPLGVGLAATAIKMGELRYNSEDDWVVAAVRLNSSATAATDVTGFGFVGAVSNVALASAVHIAVDASSIPIYNGARHAVEVGAIPAICDDTLFTLSEVEWSEAISWETRIFLASPETSGGLLGFVAPDNLEALRGEFTSVGLVEHGSGVHIHP